MKAPPFTYVRPATLDDVLAELAIGDGSSKILAGGQSLVPVLAMRLARPSALIDINGVAGLDHLVSSDGVLEIGATVRQRLVERDVDAAAVPLLKQALPWVGHRELRSRGTVCGSLAHADPAAELPAVACCLDAEVDLRGAGGQRSLRAREFFTGAMSTAMRHDEMLTAVRVPTARPGEGFGFSEMARRHGDFALAGVAVRVHATEGRPDVADLTAFGASDRPLTRDVVAALKQAVEAVGADAPENRLAEELADPMSDVGEQLVTTSGDAHGSRGYRHRLVAVLAAQELVRAYRRATGAVDRQETG